MGILKKRHIHIVLTVLVLLSLGSCGKLKEIRVDGYRIESVEMGKRSLDAVIRLEVDNPARQLTFSDICGTIFLGDEEIADYTARPVVIAGRSAGEYPLECSVTLSDGLSIIRFMTLASRTDAGELSTDFRARVKVKGGVRRQIRLKDMPLKDLIRKK